MMDVHCEGALFVPPDRGTIIGRALWKPRYIVFGKQGRQEPTLSRPTTTSRLPSGRKPAKAPSSKPSTDDLVRGAADQLWFSIYKQKDDLELIGQYPMSSIKTCEIQSIQYRKPGPTIPTLVITIEPDVAADKARKRRSSRTGGLTSSSTHPNSLLFRTIPEERFNIYDWQVLIQPRLKPHSNFDMPMSPDSPAFSTFINPFSPSPIQERSPMSPRPEPYRRGSNATYTSTQSVQTRERSQTSTLISPSPSLRSKSSNISSQASSFGRPQGYQNMLPIQQLPADLPSPASTTGFDDQSILGWTSAQGRSSALSSHTRGSNSMSTTGTPPAPRETILDRAFMMRYIPGSDRLPGGEEDGGKLSSIARFEALMKEAEKKVTSKLNTSEPTTRKGSVPGWNLDEEDEDDEVDSDMEEPIRASTRGDSDDIEMEDDDVDPLALSIHEMPTPAQRALEYISGRSTPLAAVARRPMSPPTRNILPAELPRSKTTPPRVRTKERPKSLFYQSSSSHKHKKSDESHHSKNTSTSTSTMKRRSSNSTKRLSFTEFTQRLSSTSSLLLVQTNASSSSGGVASSRNSRQSSEASFTDELDDGILLHRGLSQSRLSGMGGVVNRPPLPEIDTKRCGGWRGSGLGVFGGEGGFL